MDQLHRRMPVALRPEHSNANNSVRVRGWVGAWLRACPEVSVCNGSMSGGTRLQQAMDISMTVEPIRSFSAALYSYGLYTYGLYSYGQ